MVNLLKLPLLVITSLLFEELLAKIPHHDSSPSTLDPARIEPLTFAQTDQLEKAPSSKFSVPTQTYLTSLGHESSKIPIPLPPPISPPPPPPPSPANAHSGTPIHGTAHKTSSLLDPTRTKPPISPPPPPPSPENAHNGTPIHGTAHKTSSLLDPTRTKPPISPPPPPPSPENAHSGTPIHGTAHKTSSLLEPTRTKPPQRPPGQRSVADYDEATTSPQTDQTLAINGSRRTPIFIPHPSPSSAPLPSNTRNGFVVGGPGNVFYSPVNQTRNKPPSRSLIQHAGGIIHENFNRTFVNKQTVPNDETDIQLSPQKLSLLYNGPNSEKHQANQVKLDRFLYYLDLNVCRHAKLEKPEEFDLGTSSQTSERLVVQCSQPTAKQLRVLINKSYPDILYAVDRNYESHMQPLLVRLIYIPGQNQYLLVTESGKHVSLLNECPSYFRLSGPTSADIKLFYQQGYHILPHNNKIFVIAADIMESRIFAVDASILSHTKNSLIPVQIILRKYQHVDVCKYSIKSLIDSYQQQYGNAFASAPKNIPDSCRSIS